MSVINSKKDATKRALIMGLVCGVVGWLLLTPSHWGFYAEGTMMFSATDDSGNPVSWGIRSGNDILAGPKFIRVDASKNFWFYGLPGWVVFIFNVAVGFAGVRIVQAMTVVPRVMVKSPDGNEYECTSEQLREDFLSGKAKEDWFARNLKDSEYKPVTEILYPNK